MASDEREGTRMDATKIVRCAAWVGSNPCAKRQEGNSIYCANHREGTMSEYGTVTVTEKGATVEATGAQLYAWAHRSGMAWPCSELATLDGIRAEFDSNGLLDLEPSPENLMADELNAWSSDVLRDVLRALYGFVEVGDVSIRVKL
jgi:hypothetical protein